MPIATTPRRSGRMGSRAVDWPRLLAWPTANGATALPDLLSEATYPSLAILKTHDAPIQVGATNNEIYLYRPGEEEKVSALEFMSVGGADNETQVWELGLYGFPYTADSVTFGPWKMFGSMRFTVTLGTRTIATQTADPYDGTQTFVSGTLRYADTYAETYNDFGDVQAYSKGFAAGNQSGHLIIHWAFVSLIAIRLVTKSATGTRELVGMYSECN